MGQRLIVNSHKFNYKTVLVVSVQRLIIAMHSIGRMNVRKWFSKYGR